jgi:hypothetical protein
MNFKIFSLVMMVALCPTAGAHELWFQAPPPAPATSVRLTFGDSPAPGEAERVAEIASAKVWGDGKPLEVRRLGDGLDARLPTPRPAVLSAYADRGVVDYQGDSFVIQLAAYAQERPLKASEVPKLGLSDDQVRLLLVEVPGKQPEVQATWKGKPVVGVAVQIFQVGKLAETVTDAEGRIGFLNPQKRPASLYIQVRDETPGTRQGKAYTHSRMKATLALPGGKTTGE